MGDMEDVQGTGIEVHIEGDALYDAMLAAVADARESVRMESYIFCDDEAGEPFVRALADAARRGVRTTLRVDHAGSMLGISREAIATLREAGTTFAWSRRWSWRHPLRFNRRNHRKLLVVDDRIAFLGGFNVHRESSRRVVGDERWRDTHVRFGGELVGDVAELFDCHGARRRWRPRRTDGMYLVTSPSRGAPVDLRRELAMRFAAARSRLWVTTPYFVPDRRTQTQLLAAARRGVDVRLLVPGKSDVPIVQWAARAAYARLLRGGVRIWEYQPRVLHAKTMLADQDWATIGTANLDYRSLFLNDEVNLVATDGRLNAMLAAQFELDVAEAREIVECAWNRRPATWMVAESIGWWARRML
ncbi:MAG TPA: phospholipase D-like domain-containing protein [Xanthomonadales bacterium]|nr:phospholipase D-like domain-containing protein [Xanthomonadales bacterium]